MADESHPQVDQVTGTVTTGHDWDGIRELNTPLPRWWLWTFYITIIWSIGYWIVYPTWPLVSSYTTGYFHWQSRQAVVDDVAAGKAQRSVLTDRIMAASLPEILGNAELLSFARAQGRAAFADNCAPCHGAGGGGAKGYPNLNDDEWLWGGKLDDIATTIRHGARSTDEKGRQGNMPAFGRDGILKRNQIEAAAEYVRVLAGFAPGPKDDLVLGKQVFVDNCVACHGETGTGNREVGAPNLKDSIWMYAPSKETIVEGIWNGRGGVMPPWAGRLDETTIKSLTVYVHSLGGGEK
jgi:cytochrome c oxidase cbb3-type subunit 3